MAKEFINEDATSADCFQIGLGNEGDAPRLKRIDSTNRLLIPEDARVGEYNNPKTLHAGGGEDFTSNMKVLTTDGTASSTTDGGNFTDVSTAASSDSASTFTFQGTTANHTILVGVDEDLSGDKIKHFGLFIKQTTAAVEVTKRSFVFERWDGSAWTEFGIMAIHENLLHRYGNEVFIRGSDDEIIFYGMDPNTTWTSKLISGDTLYWIRIRINIAVTTAPVFEQFKISTNSLRIHTDGIIKHRGLSRYVETIQAFGNIWGESGGVFSGSTNVGLGGLPTGWDHEHKNSELGTDGDAIYWQWSIPRGLDTSYPLQVNLIYDVNSADNGTSPSVIVSCKPLEVTGVLEADPAGGLTPVKRTLANTETKTSSVGQSVTVSIPASDTTKIQSSRFFGFDISDYYEGDVLFFRMELDVSNTADIVALVVQVEGVFWTPGMKIGDHR